jgi:iron(III) transport system substrate-binding protein
MNHRSHRWRPAIAMLAIVSAATMLPACSDDGAETLTIYSGREQSLVQPLLERFAEQEGVAIKVRYGDTAELAATMLEEGDNSPADIFFAQDGGALGALDAEGMFQPIPDDLLAKVDERFRAPDGTWVGFSGRARVVAYSTERLDEADLPESILDFTDPVWNGRIGWAPTNGSFQSFVTELRQVEGEDGARAWLEGIQANDPVSYESNIPAELGIADGEVDVAFVNHYYLYVLRAEEGDDFPVENGFMAPGDPGSLVNVAGGGILSTSDSEEDAQAFIRFMLGVEAQEYFASETFEYPLADGVPADPQLRPLSEIQPPDVPLGDLADLQGTLRLLQETGVLP